MQNIGKSLTLIVIGLAVLLTLSFYSKAEGSNSSISINNISTIDTTNIEGMVSEINTDLISSGASVEGLLSSKTVKAKKASDADYLVLTFDSVSYKKLSNENKRASMEIMLTEVTNSKVSSINRTKVYNFIADEDSSVSALMQQLGSDTKADYGSANTFLKPVLTRSGTVIAIFCIAILGLFVFTTLFDIAFLEFPPISSMLVSHTKEGKRPKLITNEAWRTFQEGESATEYINVLGKYAGRKWWQYVLIMFVLAYLVNGQIFVIVGSLIEYIQSVFLEL